MSNEKIWAQLDKEFGGSVLFRADETMKLAIQTVPFPSPSLNDAVGFGGLPKCRISQFHGKEGSGKTFFAMLMAKEVLDRDPDAEVLWIDAEFSFDTKWANKLGIDLSRLRLVKENNGANIFTLLCGKFNDKGKKAKPGVLDLVASKDLNVKLIVLDSIAQIIPPVEQGRGFDEQEMSALARFLPKAFRVASEMLAKTEDTAMLCINQAREKIGARVPTLDYPGGRAYRHSLSLAVLFTPSTKKENVILNDRGAKVGHKILAMVEKTRGGPDKHRAEFFLDFTRGVVKKGEEVAVLGDNYGVISRPNIQNWEYDGETIRGKDNFFNYLEENPDVMDKILKDVSAARERGVEKSMDGCEDDGLTEDSYFDDGEEDKQ